MSQVLTALATVALTLFVVVNTVFFLIFTPVMYRALRSEWPGDFPFDRPVWVYRLRHWWKRVYRRWGRRRSLIWHILLKRFLLGLFLISVFVLLNWLDHIGLNNH